MDSITWGPEIAEVYDETYAARFEPSVLGPIADLLAELARADPRWSSRLVPGECRSRRARKGSPCTASSCPRT